MGEDHKNDGGLYTYLDNKFGELHGALNDHKLENVRQITKLENKADNFTQYMVAANARHIDQEREKTDERKHRKTLFTTAIAGNLMALLALIWHFITAAAKH